MAEPATGAHAPDRETLLAHRTLDALRVEGDGVRLASAPPRSIVSVALDPQASEARDAAERGLGAPLPAIGRTASSDFRGGSTLVGLQTDQWLVLTPEGDAPAAIVREAVGQAPAVTDQSDAWTGLVLEGPRASVALERTCRLDLHPEAFAPGHAARTAMEHMAVILVRESIERFALFTPRSSEASFAHAMTVSVRAVS